MKKVLVLQGGLSSERDISLMSGQMVATALKTAGYTVVSHDLTADTDLFLKTVKQEKPDVIFNALHGRYGEDGCIQGMLNLLHIPYTHSGVLASAIGMNKNMTRQLADRIGISVAEGGLMTKAIFQTKNFKFPYVVKPNGDGSSVGVFIVHSELEKQEMLATWLPDEKKLIETYIPGRELSVAVLDDQSLGVVEIIPKTGYYDFKNKYTDGAAIHEIPAKIPETIARQVMTMAEQIHREIGCRGVSRSDFRLDDVTDAGNPKAVFLEINTNPGMTRLSLVPEIARICQGMSYEQLVSRLVEEATCDA
ncbi:MAG: D-alanine--D-alanine ligase [Alphaproteobacteria bacterium]|nr:D-alanine--D-alanine ligase [Alphaproteobacteria bacterium]